MRPEGGAPGPADWRDYPKRRQWRAINWSLSGFGPLLVALCFVYPYQYPTAFPLRIDLRYEEKKVNTLLRGSKNLHDYPNAQFAEEVTPSGLVRQTEWNYHLYIENRSYATIGPFTITLEFPGPVSAEVPYAAVATPGDRLPRDGRYMYFWRESASNHWLIFRRTCQDPLSLPQELADLANRSWCIVSAPKESPSLTPLIFGVPRLGPHLSHDLYFEIAAKREASQDCFLLVEYAVRSQVVEAQSQGRVPLDGGICK